MTKKIKGNNKITPEGIEEKSQRGKLGNHNMEKNDNLWITSQDKFKY
jgi:hypothetical protein